MREDVTGQHSGDQKSAPNKGGARAFNKHSGNHPQPLFSISYRSMNPFHGSNAGWNPSHWGLNVPLSESGRYWDFCFGAFPRTSTLLVDSRRRRLECCLSESFTIYSRLPMALVRAGTPISPFRKPPTSRLALNTSTRSSRLLKRSHETACRDHHFSGKHCF